MICIHGRQMLQKRAEGCNLGRLPWAACSTRTLAVVATGMHDLMSLQIAQIA